MLENSPTETTTQPELTGPTAATTPPQNEPKTENSFAPENTNLEKIKRAGSAVFERFNLPFKKGRGRPRKDGQPGAADVPLGPVAGDDLPADHTAARPAACPANPPAALPVDNALFRRAVVSAVKGILGFAKSLCRKKATQAGIDKEFTDKVLSDCEPEPEVMADFSESLETVLKKYNVNTEYSPEIALAVSAARLAAPYWLLLQTFNAEIERRKKNE